MTRCAQVYPSWIDLGWVQWSGTGQRERLFCIEYVRCRAAGEKTAKDGFVFDLCGEHGR